MGHDDQTYQKLLKIRASKDLKLSNNPFLKPEVVLRYYQIVGAVHMYMVKKFILGDDTGTGKCSVPETKLVTKRGIVNFLDKTLWGKKNISPVEDTFYKIPNEVGVASDGCKKATQIYYGGKKQTIYFETNIGTWGQSTKNHRWKVMGTDGFIHWRKTSDLQVGDYIAVGRNQNVWGYKKLDKEESWFLGMITGDGCYSKKNGTVVDVIGTDKGANERLLKCSKKFFIAGKAKEQKPRKKGYLNITRFWESSSDGARNFLSKYGMTPGSKSATKKIPSVLQGCRKETVCSYLQGLFDSDGYVDKWGNIELTLASKDIIEDVQLYLLNMGIVNCQKPHYNKKYKKNYYRITITDFNSRKSFFHNIGFSISYKKERLQKYVNKERELNVNYDIIPHQNEKIKRIEEIIPRGLRWAFKDQLACRSDLKRNLTYDTASKILSFEHEDFFKDSKDFQDLKEIVSKGYFFTPVTLVRDGGLRDVYDISVPDGNSYLANGMISHNTLQTIATFSTLLSKDPEQKLVVICPSSAMYQWAGEVDKFCNGVTCQIVESVNTRVRKGVTLTSYDSREYQFKKFEDEKKNVLIFNYNTMVSDFHYLKELFSKNKIMLVFDEATAFKNPKSITHKHALEIAKLPERVYGLSATIIKNNLIEAWALYNVIVPGLFASEMKFKKDYCLMEKIQLWKGKGKRGKVVNKIKGYKNLEYFKKNIDKFFLGRKKIEITPELPEIQTMEISINLTPQQQALYEEAIAGFLDFDKFKREQSLFTLGEDSEMLEEEGQNIKYIDKLTALIYCQQICNSPHLIGIDAPSAKEAEILRLLETELSGEKVVIYTRFKKMIDRLEKLIPEHCGIKVTKITGDVGNEQREINKKLFNTSEDVNVILINSAAKEAVNLQSSGFLIFFDLPFSYGDFLQIVGRIHRIGSTHEKIFLIYLMGKNTVDEKVYKTLEVKKRLFDAVLGDSAIGAIKVSEGSSSVGSIFESLLEDAKKLKNK